eukprot:6665752-Pyramimonas_sp.AAC.1
MDAPDGTEVELDVISAAPPSTLSGFAKVGGVTGGEPPPSPEVLVKSMSLRSATTALRDRLWLALNE